MGDPWELWERSGSFESSGRGLGELWKLWESFEIDIDSYRSRKAKMEQDKPRLA